MSSQDASQNSATDPQFPLLRLMKVMSIVGPIVFARIWMGFGIILFVRFLRRRE